MWITSLPRGLLVKGKEDREHPLHWNAERQNIRVPKAGDFREVLMRGTTWQILEESHSSVKRLLGAEWPAVSHRKFQDLPNDLTKLVLVLPQLRLLARAYNRQASA